MKNWITSLLTAAALALLGSAAFAKLPAPTDEAKAKAAEAAAKTAWAGKVDAFKLCQAQDKTAAHYLKTSGKGAAPASACADPGPFVYVPAGAAPAAAAAPAASAAAPAKKS
jgi:hypothetical protein